MAKLKVANIPFPHNPNFTGRADLLEKLKKALDSGECAAFTQTSAITGLGGVGKTQLALEYAYLHVDEYQVVWWVRSEEPAILAADFAGLAARLDLPEKDSQDQRITVEAVRSWLEQNGGWLLIFDNAQEPEDLISYLPRTGRGHVIITSRNPNWGGTAKTLPVDVFSRDESIQFLLNRTGQEEGADALAEALGYLPLALEQSGAYIEETGITLSDYLKRFLEEEKEILKRGKPAYFPTTVATNWEISFRQLQDESSAGADLLHLFAFLAPDNIPKSLLVAGAEQLPEPLAIAVTDELEFDDAMAALKRYSLIAIAGDSISVHRLVQAVARDRLSEVEQKRWAEAAVRLMDDAFPHDSDDVQTWPVCSVLLPHALVAAGHAERLEADPEATGRLLNQIGLYLYGRAEFDEAKSAFERALEIGKKSLGPDHPNVAAIINNLGMVLQKKGDLAGAKERFKQAIEIGEKTLGPDHPDVVARVNNLGTVLIAMGNLEGAKEHFERALKINEKAYGPDHPDVARVVNNLGSVMQAMGDLEGAKESYERALKIDEEAYGPDHPDMAFDVNNLGSVLKDMGDLAGAKEHYERALEIFQNRLGEDHPLTVKVRNNLESLRR